MGFIFVAPIYQKNLAAEALWEVVVSGQFEEGGPLGIFERALSCDSFQNSGRSRWSWKHITPGRCFTAASPKNHPFSKAKTSEQKNLRDFLFQHIIFPGCIKKPKELFVLDGFLVWGGSTMPGWYPKISTPRAMGRCSSHHRFPEGRQRQTQNQLTGGSPKTSWKEAVLGCPGTEVRINSLDRRVINWRNTPIYQVGDNNPLIRSLPSRDMQVLRLYHPFFQKPNLLLGFREYIFLIGGKFHIYTPLSMAEKLHQSIL